MAETQRHDTAFPAVTTAHDPAAHSSATPDASSTEGEAAERRTGATRPGGDGTVRRQRRGGGAAARGLMDLTAGVLGALPVLWVLGAVPWRSPNLLIEAMFRGFARCALSDGALNPIVMHCPRVGVPFGMYQLDGALSYPLAGVFLRLGVAPVTAWKVSAALIVVTGFAALFHVGRRATGSIPVALALVLVYGLSGTLSARTWNWYWNATAASLMPLVFASAHAVLESAPSRSVARVIPPGAAVLASVLLVTLEWSYAGLFAVAVAATALIVLLMGRGWSVVRRLLLLTGGLAAGAAVFLIQRGRLEIAGVTEQVGSSYETATKHSIDLALLAVPDAGSSYLGLLLRGIGLEDVLARALSEGRQLWVAPYLGVLTIGLLVGVLLWRRGRLEPTVDRPPGMLSLLLAVTVAAAVLSLGPVVQVASVAMPDVAYVAWTSPLWSDTPLRWIRYPWTWGFLTTLSLLLTVAVLTPALFRRRTSWSPLVWVLAAVVVLEFVSPPVLDAVDSPRPSVSTAPWNRLGGDQAVIAEFEAQQLPELHRALDRLGGPATLLPWNNSWIAPDLAGDGDARLRNVGIDRNVKRVMDSIPTSVGDIRDASPKLVRQLLDSGWTDAVVVLEYMPSPGAIVAHHHEHLPPGLARWQRRTERIEEDMALAGACVEPHSWFTVITRCTTDGPVASPEGRPS